MKQIFFKTTNKFISKVIIVGALLIGTIQVQAGNSTPTLSNDKAAIQYVGETSEALMLSVKINNSIGNRFTITVKDDNNEVLFSQSYNDKNFDKLFKFLKEKQDNLKYYITVSSRNKQLEQKYEVSATSKTVQSVVVNKL